MTPSTVPINGQVLAWARDEDGLSDVALAERLGVDVGTVQAWEAGDASPRRGEFSRLVEVLRRPRALFFLPSPPERSGLPAKLRSAPGLLGRELNVEERRVIRRAARVQEMTGRLLRRRGTVAVGLPRLQSGMDKEGAAEALRGWLSVSVAEQTGWRDTYQAFREWREALEDRHVLVLQLPLGSDGVRGFSLWDDFAPLVAVNTSYNYAARIFTVFHELAHLGSRTDSACSSFISPTATGGQDLRLERWCEEVASASLLPASDFRRIVGVVSGHTSSSLVSDFETARRIAARLKVSIRSVAVRLDDLDLASPGLYGLVEQNATIADRPAGGGGGGGLTTPRMRLSQLGGTIPGLVVRAAESGDIPLRDAIDVLGVNLSDFDELTSIVGRAR